jgi:amphi-Trp domain-containing protein
VSKDEIEQKATLSRQEAARWLADLAKAVGKGGTVEVALAGPPVTLHLPDELRCELEVERHGDKIELEIELKWPASGASRGGPYAKTTHT